MYVSAKNDKKFYCIAGNDCDSGEPPDIEYMEYNGRLIPALFEESAAKRFAEQYQGEHLWYPEEMTVFVMDDKKENMYRYVVYMRMDAYYYINTGPDVFKAVHQEEE